MRPSIFLLLAVLCVRSFAAETAALPSPQLLRLEATLTQKLEERKTGALPPDRYRLFAEKFRVDLDAALEQGPETSINRGRYAMILARLDESAAGQAMAGLNQALTASPGEAALLNAKGSIQLQQGDYYGAHATAEAVLKQNEDRGEPPDPEALALRHFTKGRGAPAPDAPPPAGQAARQNGFSPTRAEAHPSIEFSQRATRARVDVPLESSTEKSADDSRLARGKAALIRGKNRVEGWTDEKVLSMTRMMGVRPDEEMDTLQVSRKSGRAGAGIGGVSGLVGGAVLCSPAMETGAGYLACAGTVGAVSMAGGYVVGSFGGGFASVAWSRTKEMLGKLSVYPEKRPQEDN